MKFDKIILKQDSDEIQMALSNSILDDKKLSVETTMTSICLNYLPYNVILENDDEIMTANVKLFKSQKAEISKSLFDLEAQNVVWYNFDISDIKIKEKNSNKIYKNVMSILDSGATSVFLEYDRKSGKTEACIKLYKSLPGQTLYVCMNQSMVDYLSKKGVEAVRSDKVAFYEYVAGRIFHNIILDEYNLFFEEIGKQIIEFSKKFRHKIKIIGLSS